MPASLFTPEQKAEIARRYEQGATSDELASEYGCDRSTISRIVRAAGVTPRPSHSHFDNRIDCPYSNEALRLLYWRRGFSSTEIIFHAWENHKLLVSEKVVRRWLREARITIRTMKEAQTLRAKLRPEQFSEFHKAALAAHRPVPTELKAAVADRMRKVQKIGTKAAAKANRRTETRLCAHCGKPTTRRPSAFTRPPEHTYCSRSCSNVATKRFKSKKEKQYGHL